MTRHLIRIGSLGLLLLFWSSLAYVMRDPQTLPSPLEVLEQTLLYAQRGDLFPHIWATLYRVLWAFVLSMGLGGILGYVMGRSETLNQWLEPWLIVFLNLPALIIIILCLIWIGLNETAVITAVTLNKIPLVTTLIREAARNGSQELRDLATAYRLSPLARLRHIILPELYPALAGAARAGLSVIWKIVLVVEFLGGSGGVGIGLQLHTQFSMFNVAGVLAYALSFVVLILIVELVLLGPLERRVTIWRQHA